jgi:diguanylate cyclase (GGDEF)-like protein
LDADLAVDLGVLQEHIDGMLDRAHQNSMTYKRVQQFEMRLLAFNKLTDLIEFILEQTELLFDLDIVTLSLADPNHEISDYLNSTRYNLNEQRKLRLITDLQHPSLSSWPNQPVLGSNLAEQYRDYFSDQPVQPGSMAIVPLMRRHVCLGTLNLGSLDSKHFSANMATDFVEHLAAIVGICLENCISFETMRHSSLADPLTGVNNRRFLEQRLDEEIDRSQRSKEALSCLFLDIDYFKKINDTHGHQAGDHVLAAVASAIRKQLRSNDVLARYGGEEFVALLLQSGNDIAELIAERIRKAVAHLNVIYEDRHIAVKISVGIATFQPGSGDRPTRKVATHLIQQADAALYQAKRNGRNRIENNGFIQPE